MISTHILDTSIGQPAEGVKVMLEIFEKNYWSTLQEESTNKDGRVTFNCEKKIGDYRITFFTDEYFKKSKKEAFFLPTTVSFTISNISRKYHIPLLVTPYGYTTYRGS